MASKVQIANRALTKLGQDSILLLTDDNKAARTLNGMFDAVADAEISASRWKFALTRAQLTALVAAPDWGYGYQYPLPSDYLALVQVNEYYIRTGTKAKAPWSIEGGRLLTDMAAPLKIRYIQRVTNVALFHPLFVEALACKLAMEACEAITQSDTKFQRVSREYQYALARAQEMDAVENPPDEFPYGTWLESRQGGDVLGDGSAWSAQPGGVVVL